MRRGSKEPEESLDTVVRKSSRCSTDQSYSVALQE